MFVTFSFSDINENNAYIYVSTVDRSRKSTLYLKKKKQNKTKPAIPTTRMPLYNQEHFARIYCNIIFTF